MLHTFLFRLRHPRNIFLIFFACLSFFLNGCKEEKLAKYVFLFIGDGSSYAHRYITELASDEKLFINSLPIQGVMDVAAVSAIPDSAAASTAMATGKKVPNGVLSMNPETEEKYQQITKLLTQNGFNTALITNVNLDDATPAAFYAHALKRHSYYDIAVQVPDSAIRLFVGEAFKRPKSFKKPDLDVVLKEGGYKLFTPSKGNISYPSGKTIVTYKNIPYAIDSKDESTKLASFVKKAIAQLGKEKGFLIVVENGKIDQAAHMHDPATLVKEVKEFDEAVKEAYAFYMEHPEETLIIVTSDHETGGLTLGHQNAEDIDMSFFDLQKISAASFRTNINRFRNRRGTTASVEDFMPNVQRSFGLRILSKEEKQEMTLKAEEGDENAKTALRFNLTPAEISIMREAYRYSMMDRNKRPQTEAYKNKYDQNDPLQMAPTFILSQRAGISFTTFGHTGTPVPVSAVGKEALLFSGRYSNTEIYRKILNVLKVNEPLREIQTEPAVIQEPSEEIPEPVSNPE